MWPKVLITLYCVLIAAASLTGGWLPSLLRLTHTSRQMLMSFVGGLMLGVALLHLLPHSVSETGSLDNSLIVAVAGLVTMFFLIRIFHLHLHGPEDLESRRDDSHDAHRHEDEPFACQHDRRHALSWVGLAIGLSLHTLIDGVALAASVAVDARHEGGGWLLGVGPFLAVALHKPLDALSITTVMDVGGWTPRWRNLVNVAFSLMCPLGALAFFFGIQQLTGQHLILGLALAFAAGVFLCISLADLLPEVQFHSHDRIKLSIALLVGVALSYLIGFVEPAHTHGSHHNHQHSAGEPHHGHASHD